MCCQSEKWQYSQQIYLGKGRQDVYNIELQTQTYALCHLGIVNGAFAHNGTC